MAGLSSESDFGTKGQFMRSPSAFRNVVTAGGSSGFKAEANRYHIYVSLACPWAHRALIARKMKGLESVISTTVTDWILDDTWTFTDQKPLCSLDTVNNCQNLREIYQLAQPGYVRKVSVPVFWDKQTKKIVNNESAEILRFLNSEFNEFCETPEQRKIDLYPEPLRAEIDTLNEWIYHKINNGVYRAGFAKKQKAYESAVRDVFDGLDEVEGILSKNRFLTGNQITEADVRLFTTLIRFDPVYVLHFKCNIRRIVDYPNIWGYLRDLYSRPAFRDTTSFLHIKSHYMMSPRMNMINPLGIVAVGPQIHYDTPHDRDKIFQ